MDDYIKRENAKRAVWGCARDTGIDEAPFEYAEGLLEDVPSADVAPVRHGRWIEKRGAGGLLRMMVSIKCSVCGCEPVFDSTEHLYNYCPNCGAKMDEEETKE